jgi:hypothetical protein
MSLIMLAMSCIGPPDDIWRAMVSRRFLPKSDPSIFWRAALSFWFEPKNCMLARAPIVRRARMKAVFIVELLYI